MATLTKEDILACSGLPVAIDTETVERGLYAIYCSASKTVYVGRTMQSFAKRWTRHISYLKYKMHYNQQLQQAFNSEDYVQFFVLEMANLESKLKTREIHWINFYLDLGFNVCNVLRKTPSRETRKKISENHKLKGVRPCKEALESAAKTNKISLIGNTRAKKKK